MRRRILLLVVGMTVLVVLAFAIPLAVLIRSSVAQNSRNDTLADTGQVILALFVRGYSAPTTAEIRKEIAAESSSSGHPISVTLPSGRLVGSTPADRIGFASRTDENQLGDGQPGGDVPSTLPGGRYGAAPIADLGRSPQAQLQRVPGGQVAIAFAPSAGGVYVVRVYLSDAALHDGENERWLLLAGAAVLLVGIGVLAGEVLTRRIVRPLLQTAATAQQLSAGDTTARAPVDGPREVGDVGVALNRLADRIDQLIAEERETVADLSHRLRTPLTALRLDAEALRDPADAERVGAHVSSLERMLTAVIRAARRPQREGRMPASDATAVVGERVAFWSALAEDQARPSTVELPDSPLPVRAGAEDLAATVDALLENVIAHTPEGTAFAVRLARTEDGARLEVCDEGPGLPDDAAVRGRSDRGSSGLGLDIARRCAEASGGSMQLGAAPGGGAAITLLLHSP